MCIQEDQDTRSIDNHNIEDDNHREEENVMVEVVEEESLRNNDEEILENINVSSGLRRRTDIPGDCLNRYEKQHQ